MSELEQISAGLMADNARLQAKNARLQAERDAAIAVSNELRNDFIAYATDGVQNLSPYCANKSQSCTDKREWCIYERCNGFTPSAWRGVQEGEK